MRGHNIVADGWAGEANPQFTPNTPSNPLPNTERRPMHKKLPKRSFSHSLTLADRWTDKRTDGWTGKASYRVACLQLKTKLLKQGHST